jgi:hypothetical protein
MDVPVDPALNRLSLNPRSCWIYDLGPLWIMLFGV